MKSNEGLTLVELLVVMAILGIVLMVAASGAIANLRGTSQSRAATEVKARAVRQLETLAARALYVDTSVSPKFYYFDSYYNACTTTPLPTGCKDDGSDATLTWSIRSEKDSGTTAVEKYTSEGLITISVQATGTNNASYSIIRRLSCYDVYPSPLTSNPEPCPKVPTAGSGT